MKPKLTWLNRTLKSSLTMEQFPHLFRSTYKVAIYRENSDWFFAIYQPIRIGEFTPKMDSQYISTENPDFYYSQVTLWPLGILSFNDTAYIDMGQDWYVNGMRNALLEASYKVNRRINA